MGKILKRSVNRRKEAEKTMKEEMFNHIANQGMPVKPTMQYYYILTKLASFKNV